MAGNEPDKIAMKWHGGILTGPLVIGLVCLNMFFLACHMLFFQWHVVPIKFLSEMFDLSSECNAPTWFASILWFLVAAGTIACYCADQKMKRARANLIWLLISLTFLVASCDEVAQIHENVGSLLKERAGSSALSGILHFGSPESPWILFYAPILVLFGLISLTFLWRKLSPSIIWKALLVVAVECYVIAIGLDYFQGQTAGVQERAAIAFDMKRTSLVDTLIVIEEMLENVGTSCLVVLFANYAEQRLRLQR